MMLPVYLLWCTVRLFQFVVLLFLPAIFVIFFVYVYIYIYIYIYRYIYNILYFVYTFSESYIIVQWNSVFGNCASGIWASIKCPHLWIVCLTSGCMCPMLDFKLSCVFKNRRRLQKSKYWNLLIRTAQRAGLSLRPTSHRETTPGQYFTTYL